MPRTSHMPADDTHTIFLLQRTSHQNTRTFYDYPSVVAFAQGSSLVLSRPPPHHCPHFLIHASFPWIAVVTMFEEHLRAKNPGRPTVNYGFPELTQFIDSFYDVSALTFAPSAPCSLSPFLSHAHLSCMALANSFNSAARMYEPHDKLWVKQQCIVYLQNLLR